MPETEEERRLRKERELQGKKAETPEERAARKAKEAERDGRRKEETPEERAARKAREAERDGNRREETAEERAARKERERQEREKETPEERAARKAREAERDGHRREETAEERAARKERERQEREKETPEERAARKAKEAERESRRREETPEERAARKEREAAEKQKREVVHKPLPQTLQQQQQAQLAHQATPPPRTEPVVQARNPKLPPPPPKKDEPEEYDDDFVDGFEVEQMLEAQKAVAAENAALKKSAAASSGAGGTQGAVTSPAFVGQSRFGVDDLQRQQYRAQFDRDLARATALRRLVDLDDVSAVIADIPPLSEYDMYIRNFGNTGRQQSGAQAPPLEDKVDAEVQADRVQLKGKGSQVPEDLGLFPEKLALQSANGTTDAAVSSGGDAQSKDAASGSAAKKGPAVVDATLLSNFLSRVFPVMRTLLDEADFNSTSNLHKSSLPFSSTFTNFTVKESAQRPVVGISYSTVASQYFLSVHGPSGRASRVHKSGAANSSLNAQSEGVLPADKHAGLAVVWNSNDPSMPDKLLVHSSRLTQGCFSPTRPHLVYASCADGAVCVWDLREPDSSHATDERISTVTLRCPSYSSGWQTDNHPAEIVSMCVAGYNSVVGIRREESDQLVTLDARGNVYFWMVSDGDASRNNSSASALSVGMSGTAGAGSSDQDHGQLMASSVRVFRASAMSAFYRPPTSSLGGSMLSSSSVAAAGGGSYGRTVFSGKLASNIDFCPADASRFVVAAGTSIVHLSRFSSITAPSEYAPKSQFVGESSATPSSVTFSSLDSRILLGGYNDGTVRVYLRDEGHPQLSIPVSSSPIRRLRASNTTKLITYALDDNGTFFILDHGIEEKEVPVVQCAVGTAATGKCSTFDVPPEDKAVSQLIFGFDNGAVQLHQLNQTWLVPASARSDKWL